MFKANKPYSRVEGSSAQISKTRDMERKGERRRTFCLGFCRVLRLPLFFHLASGQLCTGTGCEFSPVVLFRPESRTSQVNRNHNIKPESKKRTRWKIKDLGTGAWGWLEVDEGLFVMYLRSKHRRIRTSLPVRREYFLTETHT